MTIFERIVSGEIPCHKVWESEKFLAFLDIRPVAPGHTLLIPKKKVDPLWSLSQGEFLELLAAAKDLAEILKKKFPCERVCMAVVGFEVPHAHIHLIPAKSIFDFPWPGGQPAAPEELSKVAKLIREDG
jgi:histidine triad (HIT) family protein